MTRLRTGGSAEPPAIAGRRITVGALADRRLEAVERAHVLALDVDVDERRDVVVLHELRAQAGEARHQVVEHLTHRDAARAHLALAARLRAEGRGDPDRAHACAGLPEQNST